MLQHGKGLDWGSRALRTLGKELSKCHHPPLIQMGALPVAHSRPALGPLPSPLSPHLPHLCLFLSKRFLPTLVLGPWVFFSVCSSLSMTLSVSVCLPLSFSLSLLLVLREADFFFLAGWEPSCPAYDCMSPPRSLPHLRVCGIVPADTTRPPDTLFPLLPLGMCLPRHQKPSPSPPPFFLC